MPVAVLARAMFSEPTTVILRVDPSNLMNRGPRCVAIVSLSNCPILGLVHMVYCAARESASLAALAVAPPGPSFALVLSS